MAQFPTVRAGVSSTQMPKANADWQNTVDGLFGGFAEGQQYGRTRDIQQGTQALLGQAGPNPNWNSLAGQLLGLGNDRGAAVASNLAQNQEMADVRRQAIQAQGAPNIPAGYQIGPNGGLAPIPGGPADREGAARAAGLQPGSPGYQAYLLTGKMPREDSQPLTATDKKAILEADEMVAANQAVISTLDKAAGLSKESLSGPFAGARATVGAMAPDWLAPNAIFGSPQQAQNTQELDNAVLSNALAQLKTIFGAAPTEGERKILLDLQGSVNQPSAVRERIYANAKAAAERRLQFNQERAQALRGESYYKPGGQPQAGGAQQPQANEAITQARAAIARGASPDAVAARLRQMGIDPEGL